MKRAVFLDRDGTIIEDAGYLNECRKIKFLPRVSTAIKLLNESRFKVIVVTNQSGVARGYFTEEIVKEINRFIQESSAKQGAFIDKIYYCPHHVQGIIQKYKKQCHCCKPNPGMIDKAVRQFSTDSKRSFASGDENSDVKAGCRTGRGIMLLADRSSPDRDGRTALMCDHIATDLREAARWILSFGVKRGVYESASN